MALAAGLVVLILFNNGGGEGEWKYTIDGNRLHMDDGYSTIDAVIRDGFGLFEELDAYLLDLYK